MIDDCYLLLRWMRVKGCMVIILGMRRASHRGLVQPSQQSVVRCDTCSGRLEIGQHLFLKLEVWDMNVHYKLRFILHVERTLRRQRP